MDRSPLPFKRSLRSAAAAALLLGGSACGDQSTNNVLPAVEPVTVEANGMPFVMNQSFDLPELTGAATASRPAIRLQAEVALSTPEEIREKLRAESVRLLKCSGFLIENMGVITSAHCYKELYWGGTTLSGSGTPVYGADGNRVNTITDLIINREADTAFGAFPGHSAEEVFDAFTATLPKDISKLLYLPNARVYTAGFPYVNGNNSTLQIFELAGMGIGSGEVEYEDGPRMMSAFLTLDKRRGEVTCRPGFSGSQAVVETPDGILRLGPYLSFGLIDEDEAGPYGPMQLEEGDATCSFALPPDPANNLKITYLG